MDKPTASDYRADTRIDWAQLGFPAVTPPTPDPLDAEIAVAWAYVDAKICRDLSAMDPNDPLAPLALRAVWMRTLQQAVQSSQGYITGVTNNLVKSFAVPGYSETKFDQLTFGNSSRFPYAQLNEWPALADLLWLLMTDECREDLIAMWNNENKPAIAVTEVDWFFPQGMNLPGRYEP